MGSFQGTASCCTPRGERVRPEQTARTGGIREGSFVRVPEKTRTWNVASGAGLVFFFFSYPLIKKL